MELLKASQVGRILNLGTRTVVRRARAGRIPGALLVGGYAYFRSDVIRAWVKAGCPVAEPLEKPPVFTITRCGMREHAGHRPRNDRTRKPSDGGLAALLDAARAVRNATGTASGD